MENNQAANNASSRGQMPLTSQSKCGHDAEKPLFNQILLMIASQQVNEKEKDKMMQKSPHIVFQIVYFEAIWKWFGRPFLKCILYIMLILNSSKQSF